MQSSPASPSERTSAVAESSYFSTPTISTSGRQRTAQACDKCRERKTKCSGEKPVCQRCTNRGLICEYSYREPRVRGPARARIVSSTPSSPGRELTAKSYSSTQTPRQEIPYSRPQASNRNHQTRDYPMGTYSTSSVTLRPHHNPSSSPYIGAESRSYSEPRAVHLPHWTDVRHGSGSNRNLTSSEPLGFTTYGFPQLQTPAPSREGGNAVGYDPYLSLRGQQPMKRQDTLRCLPNTSSFLLEAQQSPRYTHDLHYDYGTGSSTMLECTVSSSPEDSCNGYQSSSTLSSSTPTPPFYPLDHIENPSLEGHSRPMTLDYQGDPFTNRSTYDEEDTGLFSDFSYTMRGDWCIDSESNKLFSTMPDGQVHVSSRGDQNAKMLDALWPSDGPHAGLDTRCQPAHRDRMH